MRINFSTVRELLGGEKLVKLCGDREPSAAVVTLTLRGAYNNETPLPPSPDCHVTAMTGCRRTAVHIDCGTERSSGVRAGNGQHGTGLRGQRRAGVKPKFHYSDILLRGSYGKVRDLRLA